MLSQWFTRVDGTDFKRIQEVLYMGPHQPPFYSETTETTKVTRTL